MYYDMLQGKKKAGKAKANETWWPAGPREIEAWRGKGMQLLGR